MPILLPEPIKKFLCDIQISGRCCLQSFINDVTNIVVTPPSGTNINTPTWQTFLENITKLVRNFLTCGPNLIGKSIQKFLNTSIGASVLGNNPFSIFGNFG